MVIIMMAASQDDELNAGTMVPFDLIRGSHDMRITKMMNLNPKSFLKIEISEYFPGPYDKPFF